MIRLEETVTIERPIDEVYATVADFSRIASWDPGVAESAMTSPPPLRVGSTFHVVSEFGGRRIPLDYTCTELQAPHRVVLEGRTPRFSAVDRITFSEQGDSTLVHYVAEFEFHGLLRLAEPFLRGRMERIVRDGISGMKTSLERAAA